MDKGQAKTAQELLHEQRIAAAYRAIEQAKRELGQARALLRKAAAATQSST